MSLPTDEAENDTRWEVRFCCDAAGDVGVQLRCASVQYPAVSIDCWPQRLKILTTGWRQLLFSRAARHCCECRAGCHATFIVDVTLDVHLSKAACRVGRISAAAGASSSALGAGAAVAGTGAMCMATRRCPHCAVNCNGVAVME